MKLLRNVSAFLEGAELGLVVLFAAALFVALVLGVPGSLAWTLYQEGRVLLAGLVAALPMLAVLGVARDLRAGRLSWLSAGLVGDGGVCHTLDGSRCGEAKSSRGSSATATDSQRRSPSLLVCRCRSARRS